MLRCPARLLAICLCASLLTGACQFGAWNIHTQPSTPLIPFAPASAARSAVLDDFEDTSTSWLAGAWPYFSDSSATRATPSTLHATRGSQSLQLSYILGTQPKAIFYLDRELNLGLSQTIAFDLYNNEGAARAVAISLRSGPDWQWQESQPMPLKPGANAVEINLGSATFKTASTGWQYQARPSQLDAIHQIALILYPNSDGYAYVDMLLVLRKVQPQPTSAAEHGSAPYVALRSQVSSLAQMDLLELDIDTNQTADNPFDPQQIAIDLTFTAPDGRAISVPAFFFQAYDPNTHQPIWPQTWKARFTPAVEGVWEARATLKTPHVTLQSDTFRFDVTPSVARGFVRVSAENDHYLAFDNGESFFPVGLNLGWGHENPQQDYQRWLDSLQANSANVTRIWMSSWAFGLEWADSGLGRYRLDRAWQLDQVMQMAASRGVYVILVLINHGAFNITVNPEWASNPYNAALGGPCQEPVDFATNAQAQRLFEQRLRYIAARWGYATNLLAWEWWNEVDLTPIGEPNVLRPWLAQMSGALHRSDPYRHLTTISFANTSDPRLFNYPEIDFLQRHEYNANDPRSSMPKAYRDLTGYGQQPATKPILFTEFGSDTSGERPTRFDPEGIQFHNGLWASTFSGFGSAAMYWWWDNYIDLNHYWYHLKGLGDFLSDQDMGSYTMTTTQVNTNTVQAMALAGGSRALVWLRNAQYNVIQIRDAYRQAILFDGVKDADWRLTLQERRNASVTLSGLAPGQYRVEWFDTRTGQSLSLATAQSASGDLTLAAPPFQRDLAAKVTRTGN